jgi:hypothetical protein
MLEQHEEWLIWPYYVFPVIRCPGFIIITPYFSPFGTVFSNRRFRNCSATVDVGFVKISSDCFVETVFKMNDEFCWHPCSCSCIIFRKSSSMYGGPCQLVLIFSHYSNELMAPSNHLRMSAYPWKLLLWIQLTHCRWVTQICVFTLQRCKTGDANLRF